MKKLKKPKKNNLSNLKNAEGKPKLLSKTSKKTNPLQQFILETNNCSLCSISKLTSQKVYYKGSRQPTFLFIGDAPGDTDDSLGIPFAGNSGLLMKYIIENAGIPERIVGFTHAILCTPFESDLRESIRTPIMEELKNCSLKLGQMINLLKPELLIATGKKAEQSLKRLKKEFTVINSPNLIFSHGGFDSAKGQVLIKKNILVLQKLYDDFLPF